MSNNWPEPYNAAILLPVGTVVEIAERTLVSTVAPVSLQASAVKMFKKHAAGPEAQAGCGGWQSTNRDGQGSRWQHPKAVEKRVTETEAEAQLRDAPDR